MEQRSIHQIREASPRGKLVIICRQTNFAQLFIGLKVNGPLSFNEVTYSRPANLPMTSTNSLLCMSDKNSSASLMGALTANHVFYYFFAAL